MKTILTTTTLALSIAMAANFAIAATTKCQVTSVTGSRIILDCDKKAQSLNKGDDVKVRTISKKRTVEGC